MKKIYNYFILNLTSRRNRRGHRLGKWLAFHAATRRGGAL